MKKILCFVLILLFAVINFAFAADWVQIAEKIYLDESSLSEYNYKSAKYRNKNPESR